MFYSTDDTIDDDVGAVLIMDPRGGVDRYRSKCNQVDPSLIVLLGVTVVLGDADIYARRVQP